MRRLTTAFALGALVVLLTAQLTVAAQPLMDRVRLDQTSTGTVCGIEVTTHLVMTGVAFTYQDGSFMFVRRVETTWTNAEGDWVREFIAGPFRQTGTLNPDGTVTFIGEHIGVQIRLETSDGTIAAFNRGRLIFKTTIDRANETFVSEVIFQAGHYTETNFCGIITDALG